MTCIVRERNFLLSETFLKECVYHSSEYNGFYDSPITDGSTVYIVSRNNKDIGFFELIMDELDDIVTPRFWMHSRTCPMGLLSLQKASSIYAYNLVVKGCANRVVIRLKDGLSAKAIKKIIPGFIDFRFGKDYIICYLEKANIENDLSDYLIKYTGDDLIRILNI